MALVVSGSVVTSEISQLECVGSMHPRTYFEPSEQASEKLRATVGSYEICVDVRRLSAAYVLLIEWECFQPCSHG